MVTLPSSIGVRDVLKSWSDGFVDRDRKFVREFQTTFNSSFWELYLFAVLKHLQIPVDLSFTSPDFVSPTCNVAIEAVIASHSWDGTPEWKRTLKAVADTSLEDSYLESIARLSNAIANKVKSYQEKYAGLKHMLNMPYIIAVSNFGTVDFNILGDVPMQRLVYDVWNEREVLKRNGSALRLGLFRSKELRDVSAILYSSVATFGKARALGDDVGDFAFQAVRIRDNVEPMHIVASKQDYTETLPDGLRLFLNPFAKNPIDADLFDDDGIRRFRVARDGELEVTCSPRGDLCMRQVVRRVPR